MLKKALITAALGAAVVGGGTAALAASGNHTATTPSSSSAPSTSTAPTAKTKPAGKKSDKHAGKKSGRTHLGRALHGTWVTKNAKTNAVVTHDAIRGTVSAVSSTSITVKAADGVSQTYSVASSTKVLKRTATTTTPAKGHKAAASTIAAVKVGDKAAVVGTGTTSLKATHIVDGLAK